jgi:hypothetical protein
MELKPAPCPFRVAYDQVGDLHRCTGCFGDAFGKSSVKLADDLGIGCRSVREGAAAEDQLDGGGSLDALGFEAVTDGVGLQDIDGVRRVGQVPSEGAASFDTHRSGGTATAQRCQ